MIDYVYSHNIDTRVISRAHHILTEGGLVAFPTDSSWSIACSIESKQGRDKLSQLKGKDRDYTPTLLCASISQMQELALISNGHFKEIKRRVPGPFVFVLPARKHIEKIIHMKRKEVGLRISDHPIPQAILELHEHPLFVITASREMDNSHWWDHSFAQENLFEQAWELEDIQGLKQIIATGEGISRQLTTVVDMTDDVPELIRMGIEAF